MPHATSWPEDSSLRLPRNTGQAGSGQLLAQVCRRTAARTSRRPWCRKSLRTCAESPSFRAGRDVNFENSQRENSLVVFAFAQQLETSCLAMTRGHHDTFGVLGLICRLYGSLAPIAINTFIIRVSIFSNSPCASLAVPSIALPAASSFESRTPRWMSSVVPRAWA